MSFILLCIKRSKMSKARTQELMKLDFYEILEVPINAEEKEIKKSYRKKALKCHPDKNPDNKSAAEEFDQLKKILEILLDPGARAAYDKVLKGRKAAAVRARAASAKTQKLRSELEERERRAQEQPRISEEEKLRRELKRLEEEGEKIIQEELERLNKEVEKELHKPASKSTAEPEQNGYKVKVKWLATDDWPGYTEQEIHQLFYKWGDINAMVMKQKSKKGTAMIDYKTKQGADMAVQFEKGQIGKPVEVSHVSEKPPKESASKSKEPEPKAKGFDFESVADMNRRREEERKRLIEEILRSENM